ncbi:alpha/beta hydrolase family protein [Ramlibacter sp. MAHUQ-53]|uniref:alpha/beta hydrolase family protein n=1 Tax=unclassified Ramlibacter TaxID=2617605 RepID=UPI00363D2C1C
MPGAPLHVDSFLAASPPPSPDRELDQAMLRAYSIERMVDYGCALEDVLKLRRRVEAGHAWPDVARLLADDNEVRAEAAASAGQSATATRYLLHAAACCRVAQASLEEEPAQRLAVYERQARLFRAALRPAPGTGSDYFEVRHHGASHAAWLFPAATLSSGGPAVVVWGGADGWCEAFHAGVSAYLERGLSVCLLELPGQGLARLRHGSFLQPDFTRLVSATLDALVERGADPQRLGVAGHSAGGALTLAAAAADDRIRACCSNGSSDQLLRGLQKFPRVLQRFGRMLGAGAGAGAGAGVGVGEAEVAAFFDAVDLTQAARRMRASLLCLHGGQDPLVTDEEMHRLVARRGADAATLEAWPEGGHCLYNHAAERNGVIAGWFAHQLAPAASRSHP